jgi:uncharacterized protein
MDKTDFLGIGWSFPPSFTRKGVVLSEYERDIKESISILLTTSKGSRVFRPDYGSTLRKWAFSNVSLTEQTLIINEIKEAINRCEPRIEITNIVLSLEEMLEGKLLIAMDYKIRLTNRADNIVFPFYLKP